MPPPDEPPEPKDERTERLSAALRENLKRRKAQARAKERNEAADGGRNQGRASTKD
jgi:hypothetical protein